MEVYGGVVEVYGGVVEAEISIFVLNSLGAEGIYIYARNNFTPPRRAYIYARGKITNIRLLLIFYICFSLCILCQ